MSSAYGVVKEHGMLQPLPFFKNLWQQRALAKILCFVWQLAWDRIASLQNLRALNIVGKEQVICTGCNKALESAAHLFFDCEEAHDVQSVVFKWWRISTVMVNSGGSFIHGTVRAQSG